MTGAVSLRVVLTGWTTDTVGLVGLSLEVLAAGCYVAAALAERRDGRPWPWARTLSFLGGLLLLALALQSGMAGYDDSVFWVHMAQHMVVMCAAPPLLCAAAPVTLLMRRLGRAGRRRVMAVMRDPSLRILDTRASAVLLPLDYYGSMYLYLLSPVYGFAQSHLWAHEAVHAYFLGCGLVFWAPLIGADPVRWRPSQPVKRAMVVVGIPAFAGLAALADIDPARLATGTVTGVGAGLWVLAAGGALLSLAGLWALHSRARARHDRVTRATPLSERPTLAG